MTSSSTFLTIGKALNHCSFRDSNAVATQFKSNGQWITKSWQEYYNEIKYFAHFLCDLDLKAGDRVAVISNTRYEWAITDFACLGAQFVVVPVYANNTLQDIQYILNNCQAKVVIVEDRNTWSQIKTIQENCPELKTLISFTKIFEDASVVFFQDAILKGEKLHQQKENLFFERCQNILPQDTATILYTSGTTGQPKGVVLTHEQIISEVSEAFPLCGATEKDTSLSFLPYAHVLGRIELWGHMYIGYTLAFAENLEKLRDNLQEVKPTFLISVPRIFEKVYTTILSQAEANPIKSKLFHWALKIGMKVGDKKLSHQILPLDLLAEYEVANRLVLSKIRMAFGGRLRFAISGGAPLSREIALFFHACGVLILEGYGLTETTAAICVNTPFNYRFGSVGRPIGDVQIKIAEDGEILVKSKKVMKEYYQNPEATAQVLQEGWFATGDIGEFLIGGDLKITDRKKDLIKTAGGKYVAPQKIEALIKLHPLVAYAHIHGDQKKYVVAVLSLDKVHVQNFAREQNLPTNDWESLLQSAPVQDQVRKIIAEVNKSLASYESIKKFYVTSDEFTVATGELTPSLKLKRRFLDHKYQKQIEEMY